MNKYLLLLWMAGALAQELSPVTDGEVDTPEDGRPEPVERWLRYGTPNCVHRCFAARPEAFYCNHAMTHGYCCPDTSRAEC